MAADITEDKVRSCYTVVLYFHKYSVTVKNKVSILFVKKNPFTKVELFFQSTQNSHLTIFNLVFIASPLHIYPSVHLPTFSVAFQSKLQLSVSFIERLYLWSSVCLVSLLQTLHSVKCADVKFTSAIWTDVHICISGSSVSVQSIVIILHGFLTSLSSQVWLSRSKHGFYFLLPWITFTCSRSHIHESFSRTLL